MVWLKCSAVVGFKIYMNCSWEAKLAKTLVWSLWAGTYIVQIWNEWKYTPPKMCQLDAFRNAQKILENELRTHPDVPFYSQVLKSDAVASGIIYSRCDMKCFWFCWCSLYGSRGLAFLFLESWGLLNVCFFVSVTLLPLFGRRLAGLSVNLSLPLVFKAGPRWRRPPSRPSPRFGRVLVGLSVSLPRLCFNMLHFSGTWFSRIRHVKICTKNDVVLNKKKKEQCL